MTAKSTKRVRTAKRVIGYTSAQWEPRLDFAADLATRRHTFSASELIEWAAMNNQYDGKFIVAPSILAGIVLELYRPGPEAKRLLSRMETVFFPKSLQGRLTKGEAALYAAYRILEIMLDFPAWIEVPDSRLIHTKHERDAVVATGEQTIRNLRKSLRAKGIIETRSTPGKPVGVRFTEAPRHKPRAKSAV